MLICLLERLAGAVKYDDRYKFDLMTSLKLNQQ